MLMQEERTFPLPIPSTSDDFATLCPKPSLQNLTLFIENVFEEIAKVRGGGGCQSSDFAKQL
jgi:hypothetical protein